jgi:hypothetical protein
MEKQDQILCQSCGMPLYRPGEGSPYMVFLSHPVRVPADGMLTEIYVPITP